MTGVQTCALPISRSGDRFAQALEAVDGPKRRRIRLTALQWLAQQEREPQLRFDVIEVYPGGKINHIENAFE